MTMELTFLGGTGTVNCAKHRLKRRSSCKRKT
jgi:hypothetical protein